MSKYDDSRWHTDNISSEDYEKYHKYIGNHIGYFVAWMFLHGFASGEINPYAVEELVNREITPIEFFHTFCDGKFVDDMITDEGKDFADDYYAEHYLMLDYLGAFGDFPRIPEGVNFIVPDTWENYAIIDKSLTESYQYWQQEQEEI